MDPSMGLTAFLFRHRVCASLGIEEFSQNCRVGLECRFDDAHARDIVARHHHAREPHDLAEDHKDVRRHLADVMGVPHPIASKSNERVDVAEPQIAEDLLALEAHRLVVDHRRKSGQRVGAREDTVVALNAPKQTRACCARGPSARE